MKGCCYSRDSSQGETGKARTGYGIFVCLLVAVSMSAPIACAGDTSSDLSESALYSRMSALTEKRDIVGLLALESSVMRSDKTVQNIYTVALYYSDPERERQRFVSNFPTDVVGVMHDLNGTLPKVLKVGRWYPFEKLGEIAETGNAAAIKKLMEALLSSDGGVAELLGDALSATARRYPNIVLNQMSSLPKPKANRLANDPYPWCDSAHQMTLATPNNPSQAALQQALLNSSKRC
jgi:hypothetical protein